MCPPESPGSTARSQGIVTIEYSLHPLYGRQFDVVRRFRRVGLITFEILLDETRARVPEWMTRREVCAQLRCGVDPVCCLSTLRQIQELFDQHDL